MAADVLHLEDGGAVSGGLGQDPGTQRMPGTMRRLVAGEGGTPLHQTGDSSVRHLVLGQFIAGCQSPEQKLVGVAGGGHPGEEQRLGPDSIAFGHGDDDTFARLVGLRFRDPQSYALVGQTDIRPVFFGSFN